MTLYTTFVCYNAAVLIYITYLAHTHLTTTSLQIFGLFIRRFQIEGGRSIKKKYIWYQCIVVGVFRIRITVGKRRIKHHCWQSMGQLHGNILKKNFVQSIFNINLSEHAQISWNHVDALVFMTALKVLYNDTGEGCEC